jgi:hypothetical protein
MDTDRRIEDPTREAGPRTLIDNREVPREREMRIMQIEAETLDGLRSITKMPGKTIPAALESPTKI